MLDIVKNKVNAFIKIFVLQIIKSLSWFANTFSNILSFVFTVQTLKFHVSIVSPSFRRVEKSLVLIAIVGVRYQVVSVILFSLLKFQYKNIHQFLFSLPLIRTFQNFCAILYSLYAFIFLCVSSIYHHRRDKTFEYYIFMHWNLK